jgi:hypothetical protein
VAREVTSLSEVINTHVVLPESTLPQGAFSICSAKTISRHELVEKVTALSGHSPKKLSLTDFSRRNDIPVLCGDNFRLWDSAGWQIMQDIEVIRKRMLHGKLRLLLR